MMALPHRQPTESGRWASYTRMPPRYQRSVHLERDSADDHALDGYILTPLGAQIAGRIRNGLAATQGNRAWSLTGPYGSGKSAFALFLEGHLGVPDGRFAKPARALGGLQGQVGNLLPVVATGERRPLDQLLLGALCDSIRKHQGKGSARSASQLASEAHRLYTRSLRKGAVTPRDVVNLFGWYSRAASSVHSSAHGILILLDEAGKVLEHLAQGPSSGDIQLLQELAEAANRSGSDPIVLVVLLHQSFERYATRLGQAERDEWSKVQGRFEDVAFHEAPDQVLRLIGSALGRTSLPSGVRSYAARATEEASKLCGLATDNGKRVHLKSLLERALPLHPITALLLGPLFKSRLAQNERSLFAFLASSEPFGFQDFIADPNGTRQSEPFFTPDRLYQYVAATLAGRLYGTAARDWARIESALHRLPPAATELDARLIKTVGLLSALGDVSGLRASKQVLRLALGGSSSGQSFHAELDATIERLQSASLLVYRKYSGAYQLWDGSDIDLDREFRKARADLAPDQGFRSRLERLVSPRPLLARRHFLQSGHLRYFEVRFGDEASILSSSEWKRTEEADGIVYFVFPTSNGAAKRLNEFLSDPKNWPDRGDAARPTVVAIPTNPDRIRDLLLDVAAWEKAQTSVPGISADPVARHELEGRLSEARCLLAANTQEVVRGRNCTWLHDGKVLPIDSPRALAETLSSICDRAYKLAPHIHNELLNRRTLSSAAAAGRRTLLEAMLERAHLPRLAMENAPAEMSMYRSVLERHGIHAERDNKLGFGPPVKDGPGSALPAYSRIRREITAAVAARLSLPSLYEPLRAPPYGMRGGVLPVFLLAVLLECRDEIALFEEGAFVPVLTTAVVERMLRNPDAFALQHVALVGERAEFCRTLAGLDGSQKADVLPIVRGIVGIVRGLPPYARTTKALSQQALAVREAVLLAKDPIALLFKDLPAACGMEPLDPHRSSSSGRTATFTVTLKSALRELSGAYPSLLANIRTSLARELGLTEDLPSLRQELAARSEPLLGAAADPLLKGLLLRIGAASLSDEDWLASVATLLGGKPPESWLDADYDQFRLNLGLVRRRFSTLEALLCAPDSLSTSRAAVAVRLSVAQAGHPEQERIVRVSTSDGKAFNRTCKQIQEVVEANRGELSREAAIAALAIVARELLGNLDTSQPKEGLRGE